jgi:hypothetical protein
MTRANPKSLAARINEVERLGLTLERFGGLTVDECADGLKLAIEVIAELKERLLAIRDASDLSREWGDL